MPSINLLPWRAELRQRRQKEFLIGLGAAASAGVVIALLAHFAVSTMIDAQQRRNELIKAEIAELDKQIAEILVLEEQKARMVARMEVIEKLQKSRPEVVKLFDDVVTTLPEGVYLTTLKQSQRRLEFAGVAQSSTRVSSFMRNIDGSEAMANPELKVIETSAPGAGASFTLFAQMKAADPEAEAEAGAAAKPNRRVQEARR
ncbi:MAG: PilN domain-containing protein [Steroidobacteraceae bacterium]|jgi:type IV pilus assembly protein PilN|nr:PilN domain-containing protein [Steroidobacteraceae bacterium]